MDNEQSYRRSVTYFFDAGGENWEVIGWGEDYVEIEETRKNGQEDCHLGAEFGIVGGQWVLLFDDQDWEPQIVDYLGRRAVYDIIDYLTKHGPPPTKE